MARSLRTEEIREFNFLLNRRDPPRSVSVREQFLPHRGEDDCENATGETVEGVWCSFPNIKPNDFGK